MSCTIYDCLDCGAFWSVNTDDKCPECGSTNITSEFDEEFDEVEEDD